MSWLLWQLADSAFPAGGFGHSAGLEAALQGGEVAGPGGLAQFVADTLWQAGHGALPLLGAAHREPDRLDEWDRACDVFLVGEAQNRASRTQGQAFLATCARCFPGEGARDLRALRAEAMRAGLPCHHAPVFGAALSLLGVERDAARRLFLYQTARGVLSAGVRLGVIGPYQGQQLQHGLGPLCDEVLDRCRDLPPEETAQCAPLLDLFHSLHDRLYSRLFLS